VTLENIISGTAISNIYHLKSNAYLSSEKILEKYIQKDPIAKDVMDGFIKSLAQSLSDLALTFNSGGGILLAGSLMRSLYPMIDKNNFYKNFTLNKFDSHMNMLNLISIGVITKECSPLYGNLSFYKKLKN
jgi:glucokinase